MTKLQKHITYCLLPTAYCLLLALCNPFAINETYANEQEVPYTLADRDRLIRVEADQKALRNEMNAKFDGVDAKFEAMNAKFEAMDSKIQVLYSGFGIMITLMLFLFGYIVFDRKTSMQPLQQQVFELKLSNEKIISIIKQRAETDNGFKELLKRVAL